MRLLFALLLPLLGHGQQFLQLSGGAQFVRFEEGKFKGFAVVHAGSASVEQSQPAELEFYIAPGHIERRSAGYDSVTLASGRAVGIAKLAGPGNSRFTFRDEWVVAGGTLRLSRSVRVTGNSPAGFLSAIVFRHPERHPRAQVDYFAPGMIYGSTAHLSAEAIGGSLTYTHGHGQLHIREDRLPAPLFGIHFADGSALTMLDPSPDAATTLADSRDTEIKTLLDGRYRFGAIGADLDDGHHAQGFWYPGSEGEVTYRGNTYPGGQVHNWRRRYHPIRDGFVQQYRVEFRFSKGEDFPSYFKNAWRWAYALLNPPVRPQDLAAARQSLLDVLGSQVERHGDRTGIPNAVSTVPDRHVRDRKAIMGFTGRNLEAAEFLLNEPRYRPAGLAIFSSFVRLKMNPPVSEGFHLDTGEPALAIPRTGCVFLRSFGDAMKKLFVRTTRSAGVASFMKIGLPGRGNSATGCSPSKHRRARFRVRGSRSAARWPTHRRNRATMPFHFWSVYPGRRAMLATCVRPSARLSSFGKMASRARPSPEAPSIILTSSIKKPAHCRSKHISRSIAQHTTRNG